jgi:hypothetical protein
MTRSLPGAAIGRLPTCFTLAAVLALSGCAGARKQSRRESPPDRARAISALRGAYAAFNRGDIEAAVDAEIEWIEPAEFPGGGTYHGREAVKRYLTQSRAGWAEGSSEPERFIASGSRIVVFVEARVRLRDSVQWQEVRLADVYTMRRGKAVQMRAFADRMQALHWAGVEEPGR